jgi:F-type H+-transporting ATPase subunit b
MPQLDIGTYSAQLFWLFVAFLLLWGGIYLLLPRLGAVFAKRERHIKTLIAEARQVEERAEAILEAQEAHLTKERAAAKKSLEEALVAMHNRVREEKYRLSEETHARVAEETGKLTAAFERQVQGTEPLTHKMAKAFLSKIDKLYIPSP